MDFFFVLGTKLLDGHDLRGEGGVFNGFLQEVVVGYKELELWHENLGLPLPDLFRMERTVLVDEVLKSQSGETNGESFK